MVLIPPGRPNHILSRFRTVLSKPQFENFRGVTFELTSGCKEHDVKSIRDTVGETKFQSSINRFFTSPPGIWKMLRNFSSLFLIL